MTATTPADLTDRQRDVLKLVRAGKNPTEIGKDLGISSQGVHGHLRRLRERGLIEGEQPRRKQKANGVHVDATKALEAVHDAIRHQEEAILQRLSDIDEEQQRLQGESAELQATLEQLRALRAKQTAAATPPAPAEKPEAPAKEPARKR